MRHYGGFQGAPFHGHVGKIHQRPVGESQSQIQIPQADVAVHAQHPSAALGQRGAHTSGEGGFPGAALAGHHGDTLSPHCATSFQPLL